MKGAFEQYFKIGALGADCFKRLRLSALFRMFQEASVAHSESLGAGSDKTLDRGALWIVSRVRLSIRRLPVYGEEAVLKTWPGKTMRVVFPRYYSLELQSGEKLLYASSLWVLIGEKDRAVVFPESLGIKIEGCEDGQIPLPESFCPPPSTNVAERREVRLSDLDLNGHMNNARFLDWAADLCPDSLGRAQLSGLQINFISEARLGQTVELARAYENGRLYVTGMDGAKPVFALWAQINHKAGG